MSREGDSSAEQEDPGAKEIDAEAEQSEGEKKDGLEAQGSESGALSTPILYTPYPNLALEDVYDLRQPPHREVGVVGYLLRKPDRNRNPTTNGSGEQARGRHKVILASGRRKPTANVVSAPSTTRPLTTAARNFHGTTVGRTRYRLKLLAEVEGRWRGLLFLGFLAASLEATLRERFCWTRL